MVSPLYAQKLNDVFDRIYVHGVAEVPRAELLLWHDNQQRVTKKLWRNIQDTWASRCKTEWDYEEAPVLSRAFVPETRAYVLVWEGERDPQTGEIKRWFRPLSEVDEAEENEDE